MLHGHYATAPLSAEEEEKITVQRQPASRSTINVVEAQTTLTSTTTEGSSSSYVLLFLFAILVCRYVLPYALDSWLHLLDKRHRRFIRQHHAALEQGSGFRTVPHLRTPHLKIRPTVTRSSPPTAYQHILQHNKSSSLLESPVSRNSQYSIEHWHLECVEGRQRWIYIGPGYRQTFLEQYLLGLTPGHPNPPQDLASPASNSSGWDSCDVASSGTDAGGQTVADSIRRGIDFLSKLQDPRDGHWPNDYSGPMFLLPGAVITRYVICRGDTSAMWPAEHRYEMLRYLINHQNEDGGWGMHTEGHSSMFGTVLNYVAFRLLGGNYEKDEHDTARRASLWIKERGGAASVPSWGKVWLAVLGLYEYQGINAVPPEMWMIPRSLPLNMLRTWCHSRIVALPFSFLYGTKWQCPLDNRLKAIREEIYGPPPTPSQSKIPSGKPYDDIDWAKQRSNVFKSDLYFPAHWLYELCNAVMLAYEAFCPSFLKNPIRQRALDIVFNHMQYDDDTTDFICLGPVNKCFNHLITWIKCEESQKRQQHQQQQQVRNNKYTNRKGLSLEQQVQRHEERLADYLFLGPEGMRMSGYNGSQLWDTSFAVQAIVACGEVHMREHRSLLRDAHKYIDVAQVVEEPPEAYRYGRSAAKGAWNFSTRAQSWQVSDCTAEGLRVVLMLRHGSAGAGGGLYCDNVFPTERILDAVDVILALRNKNTSTLPLTPSSRHTQKYSSNAEVWGKNYGGGGWASYEEVRGPRWLELFNCAEVYKDIMIEYEYTECTSSCTQTLAMFRREFPHYRKEEVEAAILDGVATVLRLQRRDGSWYGSWGVCFTYGCFFAVEALRAANVSPATHPDVFRRCADFLLSKQNTNENKGQQPALADADGGWGEDFNSCATQEWCQSPDGSQVVNTAWAVIALVGCFPLQAEAGAVSDEQDERRRAYLRAIRRGVRLILRRQRVDGDWKQERISGVFNGNCAIHYPSYKNNMTIWALGRYRSLILDLQNESNAYGSFTEARGGSMKDLYMLHDDGDFKALVDIDYGIAH